MCKCKCKFTNAKCWMQMLNAQTPENANTLLCCLGAVPYLPCRRSRRRNYALEANEQPSTACEHHRDRLRGCERNAHWKQLGVCDVACGMVEFVYLYNCAFAQLYICAFVHLCIWFGVEHLAFEPLSICAFAHLGTWAFEHLVIWAFGHLSIYMLHFTICAFAHVMQQLSFICRSV